MRKRMVLMICACMMAVGAAWAQKVYGDKSGKPDAIFSYVA